MLYNFGPHVIHSGEQIFFASKHSLGLVNLKPIVAGHVLVIPKRVCARLSDLNEIESADFFKSIRLISRGIEKYHKAQSLTLTIQDGPQAGQSVPHLHMHIIPRYEGDWMNNDDIYAEINRREKQLCQELGRKIVPDSDRKARESDDMKNETLTLKQLFPETDNIWE
jgi:bis(5'-adenosyl)-triphosphatase